MQTVAATARAHATSAMTLALLLRHTAACTRQQPAVADALISNEGRPVAIYRDWCVTETSATVARMADGVEPPSASDILARAAIAASPRFAGSAMVLYEGFRDRRRARMRDVEDAVRAAVPGDADLDQILGSRDELDALLNRALIEAGQSAMPAKRRVLGKVVANALVDEAEVDWASLVMTVLAQIDAPHVRAMARIRDAVGKADAAGGLPPRAEGAEAELNPRIRAAGRAEPEPIIAALTALGLIEATSTYGGEPIVVGMTPFGDRLLDELDAAGQEELASDSDPRGI